MKERNSVVDVDSNNEITDCIANYIDDISRKFDPEIPPIYSVYFFYEQNQGFFTIWTFFDFPKYIEDNIPNIILEYTSSKVLNNDVVFIYDQELSEIRELIYSSANINILNDSAIIERNIIYDGPWYPKTFEYNISDSKITLKAADSILIWFLGEDYIKYENYLEAN